MDPLTVATSDWREDRRCQADTIPVFNINYRVFEEFCFEVGLKEAEEFPKCAFISAELETPGFWCLLSCP